MPTSHDHLPRIFYLLMGLVFAIALLFFNYRADTISAHNRTVEPLSQLKQLDAQLDEQLLLMHAFRLNHFDSIATTRQAIEAINGLLADPQGNLHEVYGATFEHSVHQYLDSSEQKLSRLERFKSLIALTGNSLRYLPRAASRFSDQLRDERGQRVMTLVAELLNYSIFPEREARLALDAKIDALRHDYWLEDEQPIIDNILQHARFSLHQREQVALQLDAYLEVDTAQRIDAMSNAYLDHYTEARRRSEQLALFLSVLVLLLFFGLGFTMRSLQRARHTAERTWEQLNDAIESIGEGFALYDANDRLLLWNRNFVNAYPRSAAQLCVGMSYRELLESNLARGEYQLDIPADAWLELHLQREGRSMRERRSDGRIFQLNNYRTGDGGRVTVLADITTRLAADAELRKLSRAVEQSPVSVMITNTDGQIEYVNRKFSEVTGYVEEEVLGHNPRILKGGEMNHEAYAQLWHTIATQGEWRGEFHNRRKNGELFWEAASISAIRNASGQATHYLALKEDITERKEAEEQLHLAAAVFDTSSEGIMVTDAQSRIITINPAFSRITGYSADEAIGQHPSLLRSGRQDADFYAAMWQRLSCGERWEGEIWNRRKNGEIYPEWLSITSVRDAEGEVRQFVAVFSDITKRKQDEAKIRWQANYDPLTHLPNRALFTDRLEQALANSRREQWLSALLFIDLDRFKAVNDTYGHAVGDRLLVLVAERLQAQVRESDTVARLGGDEFTIILQDVSGQSAVASVAEALIDALASPFEIDAIELFIGATLGIAIYPGDAELAEEMLRNADLAMYQAKQAGRNCYHFYTESMNEDIQRRSRLEADLHRAIERDELEAWFQPIVHARTGEVYGAEVLMRWQHPEHGLLLPGEFIPLAEETGLIGRIGEWVLESACRQAAKWRAADLPPLQISVNLSSQQRQQGLDSALLAKILERSAFPPEGLTLEITEGMLLEQSEENIRWLNEFKALGVTLSIDDFGTGYSSLSYLQRFPFDTLKIDKSFVTELSSGSADAALVQAIIALAGSFRLRVVAEGVEHQEQYDYLAELGCDLIQGFLISQALDPAAFAEFVVQRTASEQTP